MLCEKEKHLSASGSQGIHACVLYHGQEQWLQHVLRLIERSDFDRSDFDRNDFKRSDFKRSDFELSSGPGTLKPSTLRAGGGATTRGPRLREKKVNKEYRERIAILIPEHSLDWTQETLGQFIELEGHIEFGIVEDLFSSWAEINIELCEARLERAIARCTAEGFDGLRVVIDMSWLSDPTLSSEQVESCIQTIDSIVQKNSLSVFAGYDRNMFSSRRLLNILPFYPSVWVNEGLSENIYHIDSRFYSGNKVQHEAMLEFVLTQFEVDAGRLGRAELESALRLLKQIIESMGDGVIVTDTDGAVLLFNKTGSEIIGCTQSELPLHTRARTFGNFLPDKVTPFPIEDLPISKAIRGVEVDQVEIFIRNEFRPEGRWVSATGRPLKTIDGDIRGGVVVFRDITQKKLNDEERQQLEARMLQTQKLESLGLLAGGIAHDFNNLLMGVLGHAGLALEHASPQNIERITHIQKTALHLSELTNQLLEFAGKGSYANRTTDVQRLVCELCGMIQPILSKKATLEFDFSDDSLVVLSDPSQLRQVVMNLVTNASDALGDSPGSITISTKRRRVEQEELKTAILNDGLSTGDYISIKITDTGMGISPERLQRIFDPFFTTKASGRGLGLAAVLGLVRRHGGALIVDTQLGKGTSFEVLLPPSDEVLAQEPPPRLQKTLKEPATVLIIDDEEIVRSVAQQILEFAGYSVKIAASGSEGLQVFLDNQKCIDTILLDISMPDMDGRDVYSRLREANPNVNIVLSSGYTENEMLHDFPAEGLSGFLQKPYSPEKLIDLLRQLRQ